MLAFGLVSVAACGQGTGADADRVARGEQETGSRPPAIILITLDTTRADRIGLYGGQRVPTPHIDAIGEQGVVFEHAFSQVPLTLPAHSSMMTGRYPASHGVRHNGLFRLPKDEVTLAERLAAEGYETAAFVGAYVLNEGFGLEQGFALYDDIEEQRVAHRAGELGVERTAEAVNASVFEWIETRAPGPFFLWVHYFDPHKPYAPPEDSPYELHGRAYDREISYMDACLGALVDRLDAAGMLEGSVMLVVADHGESLGEHREQTHGVFLYESPVHVPMMIRGPKYVPTGIRVPGPVELVDVFPTLLEFAGQVPRQEQQGVSLLPAIDASMSPRQFAFAETMMPRIDFGWSPLWMVRDLRYKYIEAPRPELYDLVEDPRENRNLIDEQPRRAARMRQALKAWRLETGEAGASAPQDAPMHPEQVERLQALGYVGQRTFNLEEDEGRSLPDPKDRIDEARKVFQARDLMSDGRFGRAVSVLQTLMRDNPDNHVGRRSLVRALMASGQLLAAAEQAESGLERAKRDPDASAVLELEMRRTLAEIHWRLGHTSDAVAHQKEADRLAEAMPKLPPTLDRRFDPQARIAKAKRLLDQSDQLASGTDPRAIIARFELALTSGEAALALEAARKIAELRVGEPGTLIRASQVLSRNGEHALAVSCLRQAIDRYGENADLLGRLGTAQIAAGRLDVAEETFRRLDQMLPADPRPLFFLGNIALLKGEPEKAKRLYDRALDRDGSFVEPLVNYARWQLEAGRPKAAVETLQEALNRNPDSEPARELLGHLQERRP